MDFNEFVTEKEENKCTALQHRGTLSLTEFNDRIKALDDTTRPVIYLMDPVTKIVTPMRMGMVGGHMGAVEV